MKSSMLFAIRVTAFPQNNIAVVQAAQAQEFYVEFNRQNHLSTTSSLHALIIQNPVFLFHLRIPDGAQMLEVRVRFADGKPLLRSGKVIPAAAADVPLKLAGDVTHGRAVGALQNVPRLVEPVLVMRIQLLDALPMVLHQKAVRRKQVVDVHVVRAREALQVRSENVTVLKSPERDVRRNLP